jgi:hypothetical protein
MDLDSDPVPRLLLPDMHRPRLYQINMSPPFSSGTRMLAFKSTYLTHCDFLCIMTEAPWQCSSNFSRHLFMLEAIFSYTALTGIHLLLAPHHKYSVTISRHGDSN